MGPDSALLESLRRLNTLRLSAVRSEERDHLESLFEGRFGASRRLTVYGTLAPGEINAGQLAGLDGQWAPAKVRGVRYPEGWGAVTGYPAFRWDEAGDAVPVRLFKSAELPFHWPRLDRFEGRAYGRILVPVSIGDAWTVGNIYEARER